jgi:hypothetical protein
VVLYSLEVTTFWLVTSYEVYCKGPLLVKVMAKEVVIRTLHGLGCGKRWARTVGERRMIQP